MLPGTALIDALEPRVLLAHPTFVVSINDPGGVNAAYYTELTNTVQADGAAWAQYFNSSAEIDVELDFTNDPSVRSQGSSAGQRYLYQNGGVGVYQAGAAAKLMTGIDVNGPNSPDIIITIGDNYLANELWFDPTPGFTGTCPVDKTDAYSVFLHELGHGLGIDGYRNATTGTIDGNAETTYDLNTFYDGSNFYFNGPTAESVYGKAVPLTYGNISHVANYAPRPGSDLLGDLMNGVVFNRGTRYSISALDLAILQDTGLTPSAFPWANINGQVFFDTNRNGVPNKREPGLAGWTVYADVKGTGVYAPGDPSTVTDSKGLFNFTGLQAGRYVIRVVGRKHWTVTGPTNASGIVRAKAGVTMTAAYFGLYDAAYLSTVPSPSVASEAKPAMVASVPVIHGSLFSSMAIANIPDPSAELLQSDSTAVFQSKNRA